MQMQFYSYKTIQPNNQPVNRIYYNPVKSVHLATTTSFVSIVLIEFSLSHPMLKIEQKWFFRNALACIIL